MPRYITPSPSTSRSRSCSRSQSSLRRGRSIDPSYRARRDRSVSTSTSASAAHEAKKETIVKSSLAFIGAVGAASLLANRYWPKGVLYGEKEDWAKKPERPSRARRVRPDETGVGVAGGRRHKIEWDDGMTSEGRRSNVGSRQSFSEGIGENYHHHHQQQQQQHHNHYTVGGSGSGSGSNSNSTGRSRAAPRDRRPRIYQDAAAAAAAGSRRKSCAVDARDYTAAVAAGGAGLGEIKYIETQAPGPHSVPRRYIVDDYDAAVPRRSARRYSVVER